MTSKKKYYLLILVVAAALIVTLFVYRNKEKYISTTIAISDTILNITAQTTEKKMYDLVASITNEINRMDNILNPYNENSEIAIINKKSLENKEDVLRVEVSEDMAHLFETGLRYSKINPSFDISVRPLIELWGFGVKENQTVP